MYTTITLFIFIAFLLLYNTSKKNKWENKPAIAIKLEKQLALSRAISLLLFLLAGILLVNQNGVLSGVFSLLVFLMAMGNLIVLLFPFRYLSVSQLLFIFVLFVGFEQFIF